MGKKIIYKPGERVGHFSFVSELTKGKHRRAIFKCFCGNEFDAQVENVVSKRTKSCGCDKATNTINGKRIVSHEYNSWANMMQRCYNPLNNQFHNYGGRGVVVCDQWKSSYKNFLKDVGKRPQKDMSLDRIDVNGNYTPQNVRWATQKDQCRNTRKNELITFKGQTKCLSEWAELLGIKRSTMYSRIHNYNWPINEAFNTKKRLNQWQ